MTDERKPRVITLTLPRTDVVRLWSLLTDLSGDTELRQEIEYQMNHQGRRVARPIEADDE